MLTGNKNIQYLFWSACSLLFIAAFLYLFYAYQTVNIGPEQPIPFSHQVHSGVKKIECLYCHPYVAYSNHPGLPPVEKCLHCHKYIIANHPWIQEEHRYYNTQTPTPWIKINLVAEHVLFNHQRHINSAIECRQCHGAVETMHRLKQRRFKMGFCIECHQKKGANIDCWSACHS